MVFRRMITGMVELGFHCNGTCLGVTVIYKKWRKNNYINYIQNIMPEPVTQGDETSSRNDNPDQLQEVDEMV